MSGTSDKFKGKAEELTGKIIGDDQLEAKGHARQIGGELKDKADDIKRDIGDSINKTLDGVKDSLDDKDHKDHNEK